LLFFYNKLQAFNLGYRRQILACLRYIGLRYFVQFLSCLQRHGSLHCLQRHGSLQTTRTVITQNSQICRGSMLHLFFWDIWFCFDNLRYLEVRLYLERFCTIQLNTGHSIQRVSNCNTGSWGQTTCICKRYLSTLSDIVYLESEFIRQSTSGIYL
jgi:hypothetical protein